MNVTKSISIALMIAAVSGMARAEQPVEQYGRGSKPAGVIGTVAPSLGAAVAVSEVEGRSSLTRGTAPEQAAPIMLSGRSVDLQGRS